MKYYIYALQDRLVGYNTPMFLPVDKFPDELAKRNVKESLSGVPYEQLIVKAKDLDLVRLGVYDSVSGRFENEPVPEVLASCESLLKELHGIDKLYADLVPKGEEKNGSEDL